MAKPSILHSIGNGESTIFWQDPWLRPCFILKEQHGVRPIYNMGLDHSVKVSSFIRSGHWNLPPTPHPTSADMLDIWDLINSTQIPLHCTEDQYIWTADDKGMFSISSAANLHYRNLLTPDWVSLTWFQGCITGTRFSLGCISV